MRCGPVYIVTGLKVVQGLKYCKNASQAKEAIWELTPESRRSRLHEPNEQREEEGVEVEEVTVKDTKHFAEDEEYGDVEETKFEDEEEEWSLLVGSGCSAVSQSG